MTAVNTGVSSGAAPAMPASRLAGLVPAVDELIMASLVKSAAIGAGPGDKERLSLQQTSVNFRKFVQKSGPVFVAQDAIEAVLLWQDPSKTLFFACYNPNLILAVPGLALAATLLSTHAARHQPSSTGKDAREGVALSSAPPAEDSVDYLANMQNIQIMMGRVSDLTDFLRLFVPYLTWRDERVSLVLLQLSMVSALALVLAAPYVPWRLVMLVGGEAVFLAGHPVAQAFMVESLSVVKPFLEQSWKGAARLAEDDSLEDSDLDGEIVEVERIEVESRLDQQWLPEVVIGGETPSGFEWLSTGDWEVDTAYAGGKVDSFGYMYVYLDGTAGAAALGPSGTHAQTTRAAATALADHDFVSRRVKRHLAELEKTNYSEQGTSTKLFRQPTDDDTDEAGGRGSTSYSSEDPQGRKRKKTMAVRSLLLYRKSLTTLMEENDGDQFPKSTYTYATAAARPSVFPPLQLCSVCGYRGKYVCGKCGMRFCDLGCKAIHEDNRCEKR
ncbi:hypothetical protein OIV83_006407 [Microbotryomycetes sp. JL201]|nr:hypothetical protein OIV83_006407 [Microbotryomycetes sp. JL201]